MKKAILFVLIGSFLGLNAGYAQNAPTQISFESSEGYTLDTINGQNGWITISPYSSLFRVTDEQSTDGSYSLKGSLDSGNLIQNDAAVTPAISPDYSFLATDSLQISADIYLSKGQTSRNSASLDDFEWILFGQAVGNSVAFTARVIFSQGQIAVETTNPNNPDGFVYQLAGSFDYGSFFNFKMKIDYVHDTITYYVDDALIFTGDVFSGTMLSRFGFFTNGNSLFYVDNINIDDFSGMGIKDYESPGFSHFVDVANHLQLSSETPMQQVELYNLLGQKLIDRTLNGTSASIDLSALSAGIYIAKVAVDGHSKSFKIIRK